MPQMQWKEIVRREVTLKADDGKFPFRAELAWDACDPFAVTIVFGEDHEWVFARSLLADGLRSVAGIGDVSCWTTSRGFMIRLNSPDGYLVLRALVSDIKDFLRATNEITPRGKERIPMMDEKLAKWLG